VFYRRILRLLRLNEPVNDMWEALNILLLSISVCEELSIHLWSIMVESVVMVVTQSFCLVDISKKFGEADPQG
jgi:hypothetical protein